MVNKFELNKISKTILKGCNFLNEKSKNNNESLRAGAGKLMFTNGMSIEDFAHKFNLPL